MLSNITFYEIPFIVEGSADEDKLGDIQLLHALLAHNDADTHGKVNKFTTASRFPQMSEHRHKGIQTIQCMQER